MPLEVERKGVCVIWDCQKPLRDADGKRLGVRGMCWKHLKQAQRAGDLVPINGLPKGEPCRKCRRKVKHYTGLRLCNNCYQRMNRQASPNRAAMLARQREWKRAWRARNKLAKGPVMTH